MQLTFRLSWCYLALCLSFMTPVLPPLRSSTAASDASESSSDSAVRSVVESYFASYAHNDLDELIRLCSRQSPDCETVRQALVKLMPSQEAGHIDLTIDRMKVEGERATLRATAGMTITDKQNLQTVRERRAFNVQLVREDGVWKLWGMIPAVDELAAALVRAKSEEEQNQLLAQERELVDSSLLAALKEMTDPLMRKRDYPEALRLSLLAVRIAERIDDRKALGDLMTDIGAVYDKQNRYGEALETYQKSLAVYEEIGDKEGIAHSLSEIGRAQWLLSRFAQALASLSRGLAISEEIGDKSLTASILSGIGVVHRFQGRYELALEYYQKSRSLCEELNDKTTLKRVLNSIGNVYQLEGRYELALEYYQKSRAICEEVNDKVSLEVALNNIGNIHDLQGRYIEALACFHEGVRINEEMGSSADRRALAMHLANIGYVYSHEGRYDLALDYELRSLKISEELDDKHGAAVLLSNIGILYSLQGQHELALQWHQKSLKLEEEIGDKQAMAASLNNVGDIYRLQGRYDLALEYLQKSLRSHEEIGDRPGIVSTLNNLGQLWESQGNYAGMLEVSRRAAGLAKDINAPENLWTAQDQTGRALRALGQPAQARQSFLDAIATIESLRHQVAGGARGQQSFLKDKLSPYFGVIGLLVSQGEHAEALTFAERSKARVLLDVLQAGHANLRKSLLPQEESTERERRIQLVALNLQLTGELRRVKPDQARVAELRAGVEKARVEFEALETSLYVAHPELKVHRGDASIIGAEELAILLPDAATALLEYVVTDDTTYLFTVTKEPGNPAAEVRAFSLPVKRDELTRLAEGFRQQLASRDLDFRASARRLYGLLLGPAESLLRGKTSLVIVPDDQLWELPFHALLTGRNRYLIETSTIAYAPSLTILGEMRAHAGMHKADATTLLALGNPAVGKETVERATLALRNESLGPLPEAEQEVRALAKVYGPGRSTVYVGPEAREDRVKAEAGTAGILHFATHGILNDAAPMYSHLVLARGDSHEDGLLEAWELMELDLRADLAVLSACDTARGRYGAGEGVIGLTWALFVAGVPSTVVSQWQVESAGTRDLMVNFYRGLGRSAAGAAQPTKAQALRQAALKLMTSNDTRHPFYWAGFVLIGDGR